MVTSLMAVIGHWDMRPNKEMEKQQLPLHPMSGNEKESWIQVVCQHMDEPLPDSTNALCWSGIHPRAMCHHWAPVSTHPRPSNTSLENQMLHIKARSDTLLELHQVSGIAVLTETHCTSYNAIMIPFSTDSISTFLPGNASWCVEQVVNNKRYVWSSYRWKKLNT